MIHLLQKDYYGLLFLFWDAVSERAFFNEGSYLSIFFWNSVIILICSLLRKSRYAHTKAGVSAVLAFYGAALLQLLIPMDTRWQKQILLPEIMNPVTTFLRRPVGVPGIGSMTVWQLFVVIWFTGSLVQTVRLLSGRIRMMRLIDALPAVELQRSEYENVPVPDGVCVYRCCGITVPFSIGILHKKIFIPQGAYSKEQLGDIIRHEVAHLKHLDSLVVFLTDLICVLYWWNPCVYVMRRDVERSLEIRCDENAVREMDVQQTAAYMETLLTVFCGRYGNGCNGGLGMLGSGNNMRAEMRERFDALSKCRPGQKHRLCGQISVCLAAGMGILILMCSHCVVCVPYFEPPVEMFGDKMPDSYYVVSVEAYIINYANERYVLYTSQGELELPKEEVEILQAGGTEVIYVEN